MSDLTDPEDPDAAPSADVDEVAGTRAGEATDGNGPVSETDALLSLVSDGQNAEERAEAAQAASIADLIAERLRDQTVSLSIGSLTLFNDSVSFGGGFAVGGARGRGARSAGGSGGALVAISGHEQHRHIENFVQPPRYPEILEALGKEHLMVLAVAAGAGREATAFNLLAEALALNTSDTAASSCHRITDPASVTRQDWSPPHKNAGYLLLLEETAQDIAGTVDLNWLTATASALRDAHSFMVVVTGAPQGALARTVGASPHVCVELGAVDPVTIVERHVLGPVPDASVVAELRHALAESKALDALREQPRPEVAVRVAQAVRVGRNLTAEVTHLRDPSEQVHQWFLRHEDPADISFALAAAVHENAGYLTVADTALKLYSAIAPVAVASGGPGSVRFAERLVHEQPWLTVAAPDGAVGRPPQVRFRSPLVQQALLSYAWTHLDGHRGALVDWLRLSLWRDPDPEVRARAAVAAGILAWSDPRHALHRFLRAWAGSKSVPIRQGAATALSVVAQRPEHTTWVWSQLNEWVSTGSSAADRRFAKTAAMAVRGLLGRQEPERALAVLRAALDWRDDWGNLAPVAWSSVHLIDHGREREVLDAFLAWSAPQDLSPMVSKSLSAFLFAALQPYAGDGPLTTTRTASSVAQPRLLSQARMLRPELEELWARSLARRPVQDRALDTLRVWIDRYASKDHSALDSLRLLLTGIARRPGKHRQRVEYWLGRWAADPDRPSPTAARLLHAVRELP
ncbi:hypothetical protein OHB14_50245 [Streptomyces sp. NBC_01613]|uniref:hypothetical protein n=1 Tax=Streptomyces sp. NBC_01613 TaxID=2975896 RepID=UPI003870C1DB